MAACDGAMAAETVANAIADASRIFFMNIPGLERTNLNPQKCDLFRLHEKFSAT